MRGHNDSAGIYGPAFTWINGVKVFEKSQTAFWQEVARLTNIREQKEAAEQENYAKYLNSVRASEFKANPLNNGPLVPLFHTGHLGHLEVTHS